MLFTNTLTFVPRQSFVGYPAPSITFTSVVQCFEDLTRKPQRPVRSNGEANLTNNQTLKALLETAVATACVVCATTGSASAVTLTPGTTFSTFLECDNDGISLVVGQNPTDAAGWQYAIDSSTDGISGGNIGGNAYEIYSMGLMETSDRIYVAINSNTPYPGNFYRTAQNKTIAFGDLFINLNARSTNFQQASDTGSLYAIHFVKNNDSSVHKLGIYSNVTAKSVTDINSGFSSLNQYNQYVAHNGDTPSFGDLAADTSYFDLDKSLNEIASGSFLGGITMLSDSDLTDTGFNWEQAPGQHTIAFEIDKSVLPNNEPEPVPEPDAIAGFALVSAILFARRYLKVRV